LPNKSYGRRYGLYPANELAGISPEFVLKLPDSILLYPNRSPALPMDLETKARLISVGTVRLKTALSLDQASTSGPGAGCGSIFFQSGDRLVRLSVDESSPLHLSLEEGEAVIREGSRVAAVGRLVQPLAHCPHQAYITVCERCIYDCKFCAVPRLMGQPKSPEAVEGIVEACLEKGGLSAISLTSGVEVSPQAEVDRIAMLVRHLGRFNLPIGVSVIPTSQSNRILKEAGAVEVKYNVETVDPDLFEVVCPGLELEAIKEALKEAVGVFGPGRVFSNVIAGLGESDRVMREGIAELAEMGVLPVIRAVYPHPLRRQEIDMVRPSKERLLDLASHTKRCLDREGLRGDCALTMCYRCTGCDLVPHRDL